MKFRKPQYFGMFPKELSEFLCSLPAEFEIVPEGHVCVKWPEGLTRERLEFLADKIKAENVNAWESWPGQESALRALADIAPERKKRMAELWLHVSGQKVWKYNDDNWHLNTTCWRKVAGPIEIDD